MSRINTGPQEVDCDPVSGAGRTGDVYWCLGARFLVMRHT